MNNETDLQRLSDRLHTIRDQIKPSMDCAWTRPPAVRVIDCVLSLNRNYDKFLVPRLNTFQSKNREITTVLQLHTAMTDAGSAHEFVMKHLNYRDEARANTLAGVVSWLTTVAGNSTPDTQLENVQRWAAEASPKEFLTLGIKGFGLAGFQYLRMLFGANTAKPDFRICEWVAGIVGHKMAPWRCLELLERASSAAGIKLRDLDTTIWEREARGHPRGHDCVV